MTPARKAEIRAMLNAATPGPWQWFGNTKVKSLYLATVHHGRRFVMQFVRWGMQDGQPRFQVNNLMVDGSTLVRYERPYRKDVDGIDHPDARLIEQAPTLIGELLTAADDDAAELARLREIERCARLLTDAFDAPMFPVDLPPPAALRILCGSGRRASLSFGDNMSVYVVTDEDGESYRREYPDTGISDKWAIDAEDAAAMWADDAWPHYDHPDEMTCLVTSPGGTPTRYIVTVEHVPSFYAIRAPS